MDPLAINSDVATVIARVAAVLENYPRVRIIEQRADTLHATFTSLIFRFVDDVEFYVDSGAKLLHFRSASRLGYSDLGANRKRMQDLTRRLKREGIVS